MPVDTETTKPVLVHIDPEDWKEFKRIVGKRQASKRVRALIRRDIALARIAEADGRTYIICNDL